MKGDRESPFEGYKMRLKTYSKTLEKRQIVNILSNK